VSLNRAIYENNRRRDLKAPFVIQSYSKGPACFSSEIHGLFGIDKEKDLVLVLW
jgi:hypothetical protein